MNNTRITFLNNPWIQLLLVILISSGLFVAWFIQYAQPMILVNSELAKVKEEIALHKAQLQSVKNEQKSYELSREIQKLTKEKAQLSDQVVELRKTEEDNAAQNLAEQRKLKSSLEEVKKLLSTSEQKNSAQDRKNQIEKTQSFIDSTEIEIANKQSNLDKWQNELRVKFDSPKNLERAINYESLSGIWHQTGASIEGNDVFIEFLEDGKTRTYFGNQAVIFSNQKWFVEDNYLFIETIGVENENKPSNERGVLIEGKIEFARVGEFVFASNPYVRVSELEAKEIRKSIPKKNWIQKVFGSR